MGLQGDGSHQRCAVKAVTISSIVIQAEMDFTETQLVRQLLRVAKVWNIAILFTTKHSTVTVSFYFQTVISTLYLM